MTIIAISGEKTAMVPQLACIMNRKLQPDSNVLRIHILHVMKASHASTVTVDTDKYRLVGIPPDGGGPPDVRFGKHLGHNHHKQRVVKCVCM